MENLKRNKRFKVNYSKICTFKKHFKLFFLNKKLILLVFTTHSNWLPFACIPMIFLKTEKTMLPDWNWWLQPYQLQSTHFFFLRFYLFLERGEGREKKRERKEQCAGETSISCLSNAPNWGPGLQLRHVPWQGIEPATFQFVAHAWPIKPQQSGPESIINLSSNA